MLHAIICMGIVSLYCIIWGKIKGVDMKEVPHIKATVLDIRERAEYLELWDEEVDRWCKENE